MRNFEKKKRRTFGPDIMCLFALERELKIPTFFPEPQVIFSLMPRENMDANQRDSRVSALSPIPCTPTNSSKNSLEIDQ
ncbi:uncharacterized protein J3R85_020355 [Psidium guajava]|nr:uncharacterized protein J3R85_020355 [Psidium guajava]